MTNVLWRAAGRRAHLDAPGPLPDVVGATTATATSPTTTACGAGRSTSSSSSGRASGTSSTSAARRRTAPCRSAEPRCPGREWFPGADAQLRGARVCAPPATIRRSSPAPRPADRVDLSWNELRDQVARCRPGLIRLGVGRGDRVVAYLPNGPEAVVGLPRHRQPRRGLGVVPTRVRRSAASSTASASSTRSCCSRSAATGTAPSTSTAPTNSVRSAQHLPTVRSVVEVPYGGPPIPSAHRMGRPAPRRAARWSSTRSRSTIPSTCCSRRGRPGRPRRSSTGTAASSSSTSRRWPCTRISGPRDRFFWFSTTGWMMWNFLVSGLLAGSAIVLFDGDPGLSGPRLPLAAGRRDRDHLLRGERPVSDELPQQGLRLAETGDLSQVRCVGSTGAPLSAEGFRLGGRAAPGRVAHLDQRRNRRLHRVRRRIAVAARRRR